MIRAAWMLAMLLVAAPAAAQAQEAEYFDLRRVAPITGDAVRGQSRSELCAACHGPAGISIVPIYPHIAGQRADYTYWQLVKFKHAGAGDTVMAAAVAELSEQDMRDLAVYYASLPAAGPADSAAEDSGTDPDPALLARGRDLFMHGDPAAGIPPCQACHGADARGPAMATRLDAGRHAPYAAYPALRGQSQAYLLARLSEYPQGKHDGLTTGRVMADVARTLDQASIDALAAWLSSLPR